MKKQARHGDSPEPEKIDEPPETIDFIEELRKLLSRKLIQEQIDEAKECPSTHKKS